jgi:hypothetical protein
MMGEQERTESLFYYFRHGRADSRRSPVTAAGPLYRFSFVRERLKGFYSSTGRPSIDPEMLLRLLLVGYMYVKRRELGGDDRKSVLRRFFKGSCISCHRAFPHAPFDQLKWHRR